jgi:hypothetical protein
LDDYCRSLSYYNLIIYDYSSGLINFTPKQFYNAFYNDSIKKLILESRFREIFLITKFRRNRLSFPLKRMLFVSRVLFFQEVLKKLYPNNREIPDSEYFDWFGEFLLSQGFKNVFLRKTNGEIEINYCNTGYLLKDGREIILRDYDCHEINRSEFRELKTEGFITNEITEAINSIHKTFGFACGLGTKIKHGQI